MIESAESTSIRYKKQQQFYKEVLQGLKATPKYVSSKYFYDEIGDKLFQKIMQSPEYYLTRCEWEILSQQSERIAKIIKQQGSRFDVIGLGAGDGSKAAFLLKELLDNQLMTHYFPVDISAHVISSLEQQLPQKFPQLKIKGYHGEYLEMLQQIKCDSKEQKMAVFLGSNIGNFPEELAVGFCKEVQDNMHSGDLFYIGFDLKKDPQTILNAYNDQQGYTKAFNLNLLTRMNKELGGDFKEENFSHYPTYDPESGTCKSFLISQKKQTIQFENGDKIYLDKYEPIHTEVSQKYSLSDIEVLAEESGFETIDYFFDAKKWFADVLWVKK